MPIAYQKNVAKFSGVITAEEAEPLLEWLQTHPKAKVDLSALSHLHTADLQVLLAARPSIVAWPQDEGLAAWLQASFSN